MEVLKAADGREFYRIAGEIDVWLEDGGAICLKSRNKNNDPIDMGEDEAEELGNLLLGLVKKARG